MTKRKKRPWKSQQTSQKLSHTDAKAITETKDNFPSCQAAEGYDSLTESTRPRPKLFPRWTPWLVTLVTFAFRVYHVIDPSNWWVLHPDEIYQSMEVAHSELFGYGHRPYEFIPPAKGDNLSYYQQRELVLGMYALRSPIMPQYMVLVTWLAHVIGFDISNPYLIFRLSHVFVTSFLPLAVSKFTEVTCKCPDVAAFAGILTGTSAYLSTLGSHTLVNSFISPAIFFGLTQAVRVLNVHHTLTGVSPVRERKDNTNASPEDRTTSLKKSFAKENLNPNCCEKEMFLNSCPGEVQTETDKQLSGRSETSEYHSKETSYNLTIIPNLDPSNLVHCEQPLLPCENGVTIVSKTFLSPCLNPGRFDENVFQAPEMLLSQITPGYESMRSRENSSSSSDNSNDTISDFLNDNIGSNSHSNGDVELPLPKVKHFHTENLADEIRPLQKGIHGEGTWTWFLLNTFSGFLLTVAMYVRPDASLFVGIVLLSHHQLSSTVPLLRSCSARSLAFGGVLGLAVAVANDAMFYGSFVFTPMNWARFNVFGSTAGRLFGVSGSFFYLQRVFLRDVGMSVSTAVFAASVLASVLQRISSQLFQRVHLHNGAVRSSERKMHSNGIAFVTNCYEKTTLGPSSSVATSSLKLHIFCVAVLTMIYTCMGHKEERFLHDTVVLFLISVSQATILTLDFVVQFTLEIGISLGKIDSDITLSRTNNDAKIKQRQSLRFFLLSLFFLLLQTSQIEEFQSSPEIQINKWHRSSGISGRDTSLCLYYLSQQPDVSGVFIERKIIDTGGHALLHKNVPLLYLIGNDFVEFTNVSSIKLMRVCVIDKLRGHTSGIRTIDMGGGGNCTMRTSSNSINNNNKSSETASTLTNRKVRCKYKENMNGINYNMYTDFSNHKAEISNKCVVSYYSLNTISDLIHKDNTVALLRKIAGIPAAGFQQHQLNRQKPAERSQQRNHPRQHHQHHHPEPHSHTRHFQQGRHLGAELPQLQQQNHHHLHHHHHHHQQQQQQQGQHHEKASHPHAHYNYAIIQADKPFLSPSFRPVYRTPTMWVWRRVQTPQTEASLLAMIRRVQRHTSEAHARVDSRDTLSGSTNKDHKEVQSDYNTKDNRGSKVGNTVSTSIIGNSTRSNNISAGSTRSSDDKHNNSKSNNNDHIMLEYEGETLKQLGNYRAALTRFEAIALTSRGDDLQGKVKVSVLASMVYCFYRMGERKKMKTVLRECERANPRDQCLDGWRAKKLKMRPRFKAV